MVKWQIQLRGKRKKKPKIEQLWGISGMRINRSGSDSRSAPQLEKTPTRIMGFDEITGGGLPNGRPSIGDLSDTEGVPVGLDVRQAGGK
jgi:hypothetical protein